MSYGYKWKASKTAAQEYAQKMKEIEQFCRENGIDASASGDSYYFTINGQKYRVSNHSVESSNAHAYNFLGDKVREEYHPDGRKQDVIYIHAGKTRIMDIYRDLKAGYTLDGRGNRKSAPKTKKQIYASYGVLAHEYKPVYSVDRPASRAYDKIYVSLPEGWAWGENITGQTLIISPDGETYLANDILTNLGDKPALKWADNTIVLEKCREIHEREPER